MIEVRVGGQTFRISSDAGEEHIRSVALHVSECLEEARDAMGPVTGSPYKVALLAALNLADELLRERQNRQEKKKQLEEHSKELLGHLEELVDRVGTGIDVKASA